MYYILLKGWAVVFGDSAFALRLLSILFGGLTILGAYLFAAEAFGRELLTAETNADLRARVRGIGLFAAALIALSAFHIRYSQELRMYTLAAALAVFSSWALFRALQPPSRLRRREGITHLDKRLDAVAWPDDGKVVSTSLKLGVEDGVLTGEVVEGETGWPWLELEFEGRGQLIVCGFGIVKHWANGPTPRFLFAALLNRLAKGDK